MVWTQSTARPLPVARALCNLSDSSVQFCFFSNVFKRTWDGDNGARLFPAGGSRWRSETKHRHFVGPCVPADGQWERRMFGPIAGEPSLDSFTLHCAGLLCSFPAGLRSDRCTSAATVGSKLSETSQRFGSSLVPSSFRTFLVAVSIAWIL